MKDANNAALQVALNSAKLDYAFAKNKLAWLRNKDVKRLYSQVGLFASIKVYSARDQLHANVDEHYTQDDTDCAGCAVSADIATGCDTASYYYLEQHEYNIGELQVVHHIRVYSSMSNEDKATLRAIGKLQTVRGYDYETLVCSR